MLLIAMGASAQGHHKTNIVRVPDAETALKIALPKLTYVYGKKLIEREQPFTATLKDGVWSVSGTLWCGNETHTCLGGVAQIKLRQRDGKVLAVYHTH